MKWRLFDAALTLTLIGLILVSMYFDRGLSQETKACLLLNVAMDEAEMSEGWYVEAGKALKRCGFDDAKERAASKACHARRMHDAAEVCQ